MATEQETKLELFNQWLQVNGVELRGCQIKYRDSSKGFGLFSTNPNSDGVLLVVPLDLAITPMRVLEDPLLGPECRAMFQEGEVDDRFLMILFLMVERCRKNSSWKPYLDMIPSSFGSPLWFTDDEFQELQGTTLYQATKLQKKSLQAVYNDKVKCLVKKLLVLDGDSESEVDFEGFLWANSVFWTRALNIPLPRSYVFPETQEKTTNCVTSCEELVNKTDERTPMVHGSSCIGGLNIDPAQGETLWVEGLVPGIDFCNHDLTALATWDVDRTGSATGVPLSMYLLSVNHGSSEIEKEIAISYGNKGNELENWSSCWSSLKEKVATSLGRQRSMLFFFLPLLEVTEVGTSKRVQIGSPLSFIYALVTNLPDIQFNAHVIQELLYLYGFVIENNPDDYLMVHYPAEALQNIPFSDCKMQLLKAQSAELRCLLPGSLLNHGFFPQSTSENKSDWMCSQDKVYNYSWTGQLKTPSYINKLVFPQDFLASLRTIAMQEDEIFGVQSLLEELVGSDEEREPSDAEVRAAVWEACGDSGALQLLLDLLNTKMMDLEEGSGTEESDNRLLEKARIMDGVACSGSALGEELIQHEVISKNRWSSIVYRRGQKRLARLFIREAQYALELCSMEESS